MIQHFLLLSTWRIEVKPLFCCLFGAVSTLRDSDVACGGESWQPLSFVWRPLEQSRRQNWLVGNTGRSWKFVFFVVKRSVISLILLDSLLLSEGFYVMQCCTRCARSSSERQLNVHMQSWRNYFCCSSCLNILMTIIIPSVPAFCCSCWWRSSWRWCSCYAHQYKQPNSFPAGEPLQRRKN